MVIFHTNYSDIVSKTFANNAPVTGERFLTYCRAGFTSIRSSIVLSTVS
jgi:peptidyl-prolyl cis-trans isomerase B (cyclophilin B)